MCRQTCSFLDNNGDRIRKNEQVLTEIMHIGSQGSNGVAAEASSLASRCAPRRILEPAASHGEQPSGQLRSFLCVDIHRCKKRQVDGELGVIARLNTLMSGATVHSAVLVDPWFGVDALQRLITRLDSIDLNLTIITSWASSDPDTGREFARDERPVAKLEQALIQLRPIINPALTVINLTDRRDQGFHDRYLMIYPHDEPPRVFLLSNSLNSAAAKWPFVMSQLADDVTVDAQNYIEGLLENKDRARNRDLTRDFHWSTRAQ